VPDDGRPDWPVRPRDDVVVGSKPDTPTGPGSEPTSVTHGSLLYNSIYRFDDQTGPASADCSANENLRLPCHDYLRRQPPGPKLADQADTITAPTSRDVALVPVYASPSLVLMPASWGSVR
jgi:hypothetical protein